MRPLGRPWMVRRRAQPRTAVRFLPRRQAQPLLVLGPRVLVAAGSAALVQEAEVRLTRCRSTPLKGPRRRDVVLRWQLYRNPMTLFDQLRLEILGDASRPSCSPSHMLRSSELTLNQCD